MWAPAYLTMKEAVEILKKCREEIAFRPSDYKDMDEMLRVQSEKVAAWKAANPGKTWGLERLKEEDQKRGEQLAAEKAAEEEQMLWNVKHLTPEECQKIMDDCFREIGMAPLKSQMEMVQKAMDPKWDQEFCARMQAWSEKNPGKSWGQQRILEEDRKKSGQAEQTEAEKYMARTKYPQDLLPEGVKYELIVRQPGPEISDAIIDPFGLYHEEMEKRRAEKTAKEKA